MLASLNPEPGKKKKVQANGIRLSPSCRFFLSVVVQASVVLFGARVCVLRVESRPNVGELVGGCLIPSSWPRLQARGRQGCLHDGAADGEADSFLGAGLGHDVATNGEADGLLGNGLGHDAAADGEADSLDVGVLGRGRHDEGWSRKTLESQRVFCVENGGKSVVWK